MLLSGRKAAWTGQSTGLSVRLSWMRLEMHVVRSFSPVSSIVRGLAFEGVTGSSVFLGIGHILPALKAFGRAPVRSISFSMRSVNP